MMSCTPSLLHAALCPHCSALRYRPLAHADLVSLACCTPHLIRSVSCLVCSLTVRHRYASSCQHKLDPSKDDDIILALIVAAASSKHRDTPRMQLFKQGIQVL